MIKIKKTIRSFQYAFAGVLALFRSENNARVHFLAAAAAVFFGIYLKLTAVEWALIALCVGGVWGAEAFNTALEKLCDLVQADFHPQIKAVKDLAAAGVLLVVLGAVVVGIIIFIPKLWFLFY